MCVAALLSVASCSSSSSPRAASTTTSARSASTPARVALRAVVRGLDNPVALAVRRGDPALYIAEQYKARVVAVVDGAVRPAPLLDLHGAVSKGNEQGLLGVVFSPDGTRIYVDYTDPHGDSNVDEYEMRSDGTADPGSRRQVLFQRQPFPN